MDQTKDGCRIKNGICSCGFGCISEYRYETMAECNSALKGEDLHLNINIFKYVFIENIQLSNIHHNSIFVILLITIKYSRKRV